MRNALLAMAFSLIAAVGSVVGADPLFTALSVIGASARCAWTWHLSRRYVVPVARPIRHLYPYRFQFMR